MNALITLIHVGRNRVRFCVNAPFLPVSRDEVPRSGKIGQGNLVFTCKVGHGFSIAGIVRIKPTMITDGTAHIECSVHPEEEANILILPLEQALAGATGAA